MLVRRLITPGRVTRAKTELNMRFLILIHNAVGASRAADHDVDDAVSAYRALAGELARRGKLVTADRLAPPNAGRIVRSVDDQIVVTDGPFAETKEQIGGFFLIDCDDMDEALQVARRMPGARTGMLEVRPVHSPG
jgi:hypothetical protein